MKVRGEARGEDFESWACCTCAGKTNVVAGTFHGKNWKKDKEKNIKKI